MGALIVEIHGQHEFQSLTRTAAQRELLDDFGKNIELAGSVREAHKIWIALVNRTVELEGKARDRDSRIELLRHQVNELKALDLKDGEVAQLAEERTRHSNRGRLAEAAQAAVGLLYDSDEGNAHATASRALAGIKTLSSVDPRLAKVIPMVDEATIQIREAARELSRYLETLDIDPARQEEVEKRLAAIEELSRKHRVSSNELIAAPRCSRRNSPNSTAPTTISMRSRSSRPKRSMLSQARDALSAGRQTSARALQGHYGAHADPRMAGGRFLIEITQPNGEPSANGFDAVEFRVGQPGQPLRPLRQGARAASSPACHSRCRWPARPGMRAAWYSTKSIRALRCGSGNRGKGAQGAGIFRPGRLRDSPPASGEPGTSPSASLQAHRREDHAHHDFRTHHG